MGDERPRPLRHNGWFRTCRKKRIRRHRSNKRALKMSLVPPRFPITEAEIELVVTRFYARARKHPTLGPVFANHITDWTAHEAKIVNFWRNAILFDHSYSGNPMRVHMQAGDVKSAHFDDWLNLFNEVLKASLPAKSALAWAILAHRIGKGFRVGVQENARPAGTVPDLS